MNTQFPLNIYINRKNMMIRLCLYIGMAIFSFIGFWYASGKFFTEDYYYLKMSILLPFVLILFIAMIFVQLKMIRDKEPLLILDEDGIRYFNRNLKKEKRNQYIAWIDITGIQETVRDSEKILLIQSENTAIAIEKGMVDYNINDFESLLKKTMVEKQELIKK